MLKKSRRLTSAEVTALLTAGKTVSCGSVRVKYVLKDAGAKYSRFSAIVSKKVAKEASKRTLLRRRAYGAIRTLPPLRRHIDGAVFILKEATQQTIAKDFAEAISHLA